LKPEVFSFFVISGSGSTDPGESGFEAMVSTCFLTVFRIRIHLIRIQHFRLQTDPDPNLIGIEGFDNQKFIKNLQVKKNQKQQFWSKIALYRTFP
jgi:hypothetical protein